MSFTGFTAEGLKFLLENKLHNSKQWYDSHKDVYKKFVYNPFVELIEELAPVMTEIDSQIITKPSRVISRVRRDTRFTKDKSLYRDNAWIIFCKDKSRMAIVPCYWFELTQYGSSFGLGYYHATPQIMSRMRELIIQRHPAFLLALKCYESQDKFVIGGKMYKRSKAPEQPDKYKQWIDRKNIYFEHFDKGFELAFSKRLPEVLKEGFTQLKPIYDFFNMIDI